MKAIRSRIRVLLPLLFASSAIALCLPAVLHAGTGVGISPSNATIDTRGWFEPEIVISMHRLNGEALDNAGAGAGIDEKLRVKANDRGLLARQPQLPTGAFSTSGLVADGVTPLLFRVSAGGGLTQQATYDVKFTPSSFGQWASIPDLNGRLKVLDNGSFRAGAKITLSPQQPDAYLLLEPVAASEIGSNAGGKAEVKLSMRREGSWAILPDTALLYFIVRKPPIVLVHGYNAGPDSWGPNFAYLNSKLVADRGHDFVFTVGYGNDDKNYVNTYGSLDSLVGVLHRALWHQVENRNGASKWSASGNWAWTCYDAVGHSQGGVLLRLLCSSSGWPVVIGPQEDLRFRQPSNHHRGRFQRVVTVGSPHFGSTMAHLGIRMRERSLKFGSWEYAAVDFLAPLPLVPEPDEVLAKLLQPKFRIDLQTSTNATLQDLNTRYLPDLSSRLHMLGLTLDQGMVPGPRSGLPMIFRAVHLQKGDDSNKVSGKRWGEWIAPYGSDGVVDLRSQMAALNPNSPPSNASRMGSSQDIAHAPPGLVFGTSRTETGDNDVAQTVFNLLNGSSSAFGPFPSAAQCAALHSEMNASATAIEGILDGIAALQRPAGGRAYLVGGDGANDPLIQSDEPLPMDDPPHSAETINLTLQPPVGESPNGPVVWLVLVYGPNGVTTEGVTLTPSGTYGENLQIDIAAGVVGEVVASVQFPSTSDKTVIGEAGVVASRPPGALTGIELRPDAIAMAAGPSLPLEVWGVYDTGSKALLFTEAANISWLSNNLAVATVDDEGIVTLMAPGETTVQATYNGVHVAACVIDVWAPPPVITSGAVAGASAVQPFSYQITADGSPVSYTARDLPEGLSLNSASGLISGSPLYEGLFHILVGALNADAQEGNRELALTVTGTNQPPTAIGLDNGSVPAMQPSGTLVGRLATADVNPLDTFTYALVAGSGAADNGLFTISGDELRTTATIDPASKPECSIRLRATDSGGLSVEQSLLLPVLGAPVITSAPQGAIVFAGRSFVLECEASGREPLLFQWRQDGVDIPGAHGRTLEMTAGTPGSASYTVRVENAYGTETSAAAAVQVVPLSFGGWAAQFTTPESGEIPPDGDLNNDGLSNFLDFAFNWNPLLSGPSDRPFGGIVRDGADDLLTLTHRRNRLADLVYLYEWSPDLAQWFPFTPILTVPDPDADGDGSTELIEARRAIQPGESSGFLRLKVSEP